MNRTPSLVAGLFVCATVAACGTPASVLQLSSQSQADVATLSTAHQEIVDQFADYVRRDANRIAGERERLIETNRSRLLVLVDALESQARVRFEDDVTELRQEFEQALTDKFDTRVNAAIDMQEALSVRFKSEFQSNPGDFDSREMALRALVNLYYIAATGANAKVEVLYPLLESELAKVREKFEADLGDTGRQLRDAVAQFPQTTSASAPTGGAGTSPHDTLISTLAAYKQRVDSNYSHHANNLGAVHAYLSRPRASQLLIAGAVESISATINSVAGADTIFGQFLNQQVQMFGDQATQRMADFEDRSAAQLQSLLERLGSEAAREAEEVKASTLPELTEEDD